jgi:hypothetical protein
MGVSGLLIGAAYNWNEILAGKGTKNRSPASEHERLLRSERFAAVGEAAAYVRHEKEIAHDLGGFARQLDRDLNVPGAHDKN